MLKLTTEKESFITTGLYYKALLTRNLQQMDIFRSKIVSIILLLSGTLAYCEILALRTDNLRKGQIS